MIVRVLGSAAGGGVPQWNCACDNCTAARTGRRPQRTQSGLAVSGDGKRWLLLNCSPDIGSQIQAFAPVSYTHLDVYKRQFQEHQLGAEVTAYLSAPVREPKL